MSLYVWIYSTEILPTCSISRLLLGAMSRIRKTQMAQPHHNHDSRQAKPKLFVFQIKIESRRETSLSWVLKGVIRQSSFRLLILQYYCFRFTIHGKSIYLSIASVGISILNKFYMLNKVYLFTQRRQTLRNYQQRLPPALLQLAFIGLQLQKRFLGKTRNDTITVDRNSPGTVEILYWKKYKARSLLAEGVDFVGSALLLTDTALWVNDTPLWASSPFSF